MSRITLVPLALGAFLIAGACGQSSVATAAPSASGFPALASPASFPASAQPTGPGSPSRSSMPSNQHSPAASIAGATASASPVGASSVPTSARPGASDDLSGYADLTQLIPEIVGEHTLNRTLFTGEQFEAFPASVSAPMRALLKSLGREPRDLTMAIAADASARTDLTITAFRVRDVQADAFLEAYVPVLQESFPNTTITEAVLGGKSAYDVSLDGQSVGTTFLYPRDDVLFVVTGTERDLVDLAFAALP